jgi:hypothetical protein
MSDFAKWNAAAFDAAHALAHVLQESAASRLNEKGALEFMTRSALVPRHGRHTSQRLSRIVNLVDANREVAHFVARMIHAYAYVLHVPGQRYEDALCLYEMLLPVWERHGTPIDVASCRLYQAVVLQGLGRFSEALVD